MINFLVAATWAGSLKQPKTSNNSIIIDLEFDIFDDSSR